MTENKSWCPIPWNSVSTRLNGYYRLCSQSHADKVTMGIFRDKDGSILNAKHNTVEEARNCELVKDVRSAMLRGEMHTACSRCNQEDELGIPSRRQWSKTEVNQVTYDECAIHTSDDGTIDTSLFGLREADIRFGNFCNIKCRSCWPGESTAWYEDWYGLGNKKFNVNPDTVHLSNHEGKILATNDGDFRWYEQSDLLSCISATKTIKKIHISGGEPVFIKKHQEFLEMLVASGASQGIIIDYNSNITNIPDRILSLWTNFLEVRIGASIDGVGEVNDYIRYPSRWSAIEKNYKKLSTMKNCNHWVASTVMAYNILYLPELLDWVFSVHHMDDVRDISNVINMHLLRHPLHLNVQVLPPEIKEHIRSRIENWLEGQTVAVLNDHIRTQLASLVRGYLRYMLAQDLSNEFKSFLRFTRSLDEMRNESINTMLPELASLLRKHDYL